MSSWGGRKSRLASMRLSNSKTSTSSITGTRSPGSRTAGRTSTCSTGPFSPPRPPPSSTPPRRPLRRVPRRALPPGACRARRRVPHPGRVERRAPALLVVARETVLVSPDRIDRSWVHCPDPRHSDLVGQHLVQALPLPEEAERPIGLEHDLGRLGVRVVVDGGHRCAVGASAAADDEVLRLRSRHPARAERLRIAERG